MTDANDAGAKAILLPRGGEYELPPPTRKALGLDDSDDTPIRLRTRHVTAPAPGHWRLVPWGRWKRVQVRCPDCCEAFLVAARIYADGTTSAPITCPGCGWITEARFDAEGAEDIHLSVP